MEIKCRGIQNKTKMKFDSIAAISEIAKFYGELDDVFRLLSRLNTTTRRIWTDTWVKLSQDVSRKWVEIDWNDREEFYCIPTENIYVLTLFQPSSIEVSSIESLKMVQELFENVDNPQMMNISMGVNISEERDTNLTLSNYTKYMEYTSFSHLELYNKIIETAINRQINLEMLFCFVFIQEIPGLNETKFIRSIVFPWNKNFDSESMICIWNDFWETIKFDYKEVILIWDGMEIDEFMKVFLAVSETKANLKIHTSKNNGEFTKLFYWIWLDWLSQFEIKLWDNDELILWDLIRQSNKVNLRTWYYKSSLSPQNIFEFSNLCIKYQDGFKKSAANKFSIQFDKVQSLSFKCLPVALTNYELKKSSNRIYFVKNSLQIDMSTIKNVNFNVINKSSQIYILNQCITVKNKLNLQVKYFKNNNLIDLEITNIALEKDDVTSLINKIPCIGNIKTLSLQINELSSAIDILSWCRETSSITSITLVVFNGFKLVQNNKLSKIVKELKREGIRVCIYKPNNTLLNI